MTLKEIIHEIFCKECDETKKGLKDKNIRLMNEEFLLQNKLKNCDDEKAVLKEKLNNPEKSKEAKFWNNKYPKADIYYNGREVPNNNKLISVDVKLFVTPNDSYIKGEVKRFGLEIKNPKKCNDDILKIYKHCRKGAYYERDKDEVGFGEYWMFPFEFIALKKHGDCEDNAHYIASMLIAAGLPEWRVRVVCGLTRNGFGHSTVYVLADDLKTWYHINSTGGKEYLDDLTKFPTTKDKKDLLGIKHVWFSFNNKYAWHTFKTESAAKSFDSEKIPVLIKMSNKYIKG